MQIDSYLGYWEKKPAIFLKAAVPRQSNKDKRYIIMMDHIWQYTEDFYEQLNADMPPTFEGFMLAKCLDLYELFDLGSPTPRQLAEVAWLIESSVDQLLKMPPFIKQKEVIGEAELTIDGNKVVAEVKD